MNRRADIRFLLLLLLPLLFLPSSRSAAQDSVVVIWDRQKLDSTYRVDFTRLVVPDAREKYKRITLTYELECPRFGCDPWDRVGEIWIMNPEQASRHHPSELNPLFFDVEHFDMGRFVTPYGKAWSWSFDVTHLRSLLHDSVTFGSYVSIFKGSNHHGDAIGFLMSASLHFEEGEPDFYATEVTNLWNGHFYYGFPEFPIQDSLAPMVIEPSEEFGVVRVVASGHGQGNTDNAAEFARKLHELKAGEARFAQYLWRDDCGEVAAGEQYGSWQHSRAGFCPGSAIYPWINDVSRFYRPGGEILLDYDVEPYVNNCRPGVVPCPCDDCEWNDYGHTKPHILMYSQFVHYRIGRTTPALKNAFGLESIGTDRFTLTPKLDRPTDLNLTVLNAMGTIVLHHRYRSITTEPLDVDLAGTAGRYQLKVESDAGVWRRMIEVR